MEDLDCTVRVVDPIQPNKGHFHRRILLEDNVILHLVVDPLAPRALPQISFAGPDKHVESLNAAIDQGCNVRCANTYDIISFKFQDISLCS